MGERRSRVGVGGKEAATASERRWPRSRRGEGAAMARERRRSKSGSREWVSVVREQRSRLNVHEGAAKLMAGIRTTLIVAL
jgi:hypothetical protein